MTDELNSVGLPTSYPTKFPDLKELTMREVAKGSIPMARDVQDHTAAAREVIHLTPGSEELARINDRRTPTPLQGPGNAENPPVAVASARMILPPAGGPGIEPDPALSPQAAGIPGASASPFGILERPGSDIRPPLVPGVVPAAQPDGPSDAMTYGVGTRENR